MLRKIMIAVMSLIMLALLASLVIEVIAGRYLGAVALFGVASVLVWFALQMLQRKAYDEPPDQLEPLEPSELEEAETDSNPEKTD